MKTTLRPTLVLFVLLSLLTGLAYPLLVTALAQALYPAQAAGSLIVKDGKPVGSRLIGQNFSDPGHFWGRPSATSPQPHNGLASGGSNLGPLNPALIDAVKSRVQALRDAEPGNTAPLPVDLVTASASGLDPHISVAAARYQMQRVATARKLDLVRVEALVAAATERPLLGLLGEPGVNVLQLNLALDALQPQHAQTP
ncbi:MAG: potassium-transporting ATPase subunit KdpC [Rhodoferax sp.]|nr:potassium-transporting ATPase subunit KdpC [Rhodoferax sp.]